MELFWRVNLIQLFHHSLILLLKEIHMTTKVIKLKSPVEIDGERIEEMVMREPKVRDRLVAEKLSGGAAEKELGFIANLCDVTPETIAELSLADYIKIQEAVNDFLS